MIWIITVKKKKRDAVKTNKTLFLLNNAWSWKNPKFVFGILSFLIFFLKTSQVDLFPIYFGLLLF